MSANNTSETIKNFRVILLQGLPRMGKTRWVISQLAEAPSGIYVTHRHEIVGHALRIFRELTDEKTCVWLEGKARSCRTGKLKCESCPMKPDETKEDHIGYFELETIIEQLLDKYRVVTKEVLKEAETDEIIASYGGLCPYYCMRIAATKARYIFTVPQLSRELPVKELCILDEDPTIDYFYPSSVEVCEYTHNNKERNVKVLIPAKIKELSEIKRIHHAEDIRRAASFLLEVEELLQQLKEAKLTKKELDEKLELLSFPEFDEVEEVLEKLEELLPADDVKQFFEPVLFPAKKRFWWEGNENGSRLKLWMIADEERVVRSIPQAGRYILIGATRAERFAKEIADDEIKVITLRDEEPLKNFAIIVVGITEEDEKGRKRVSKEKTREALRKIILEFCNKNNDIVPVLVVTGSQEQQQRCISHLRKSKPRNLLTYAVTDEGVDAIWREYKSGAATIVYANSNVSRGVDLDFFDVEVMYNVDFSTPYWSAMAEWWEGKVTPGASEKEEVGGISEYYREMGESIIADELFNLLFRIAAVKGRYEKQPKIVFVPEYYIDRILMVATKLGMVKPIQRRLIFDWSDDEEVHFYLPDLISGILKRVRIAGIEELKEGEEQSRKNDNRNIRYRFSLLLPENSIYHVVEEDGLINYISSLVQVDKNKDVIDDRILEIIRNNLPFFYGPKTKSLSRNVLVKKIKKKVRILDDKQINYALRQLEAEGYLLRRKKGRKTYYELVRR